MKATSDEGGEGERRYCWRTGLVEQNDHERTDSGGMNLREQTIYRLVPLEVLRLRIKQLALFLGDYRGNVGRMAIKRHNSPIYISVCSRDTLRTDYGLTMKLPTGSQNTLVP